MEYADFLKLAEEKTGKNSVSEKTLRYWHVIYQWVLQHGYADTADSPEFVKHMREFRLASVGTLNAHLRHMAAAGLLKRHVLKRRLSPEAKEDLLNPVLNLFAGGKTLPTSFSRYCLPNEECSREFKSARRMSETIEARMEELRAPTPGAAQR